MKMKKIKKRMKPENKKRTGTEPALFPNINLQLFMEPKDFPAYLPQADGERCMS